ncbi:transposase [Streptomyces sp. RTGN2]|uniref:transposase n=1 Tax=Streptomyces sp. RTGN2 TaxID=3016525 RepID=UPI0025562C5A|nr:transposase [Streptomyces sp. RTGN2]
MGQSPAWPWRQLIDGIRFRVRTGVPRRDVPGEYGPWGRIYDLFRRWQRDGTWHQILTRPMWMGTRRRLCWRTRRPGAAVYLSEGRPTWRERGW